jgi:NADPH-dependent curcumin reductase CurA
MDASPINRRIVLAAHPRGLPSAQDFRIEISTLPVPDEGQVLLRTLYLSLDPYMRNLMEPVGPGYAPPVPLGHTLVGGTVSQVVASRNPGFEDGEIVLSNAGWQDYALSDGTDLVPLGAMVRPSLALGGLGMPGFTAYVGLLDIGRPQAGETVVVAAATGAVGSVVGQIARLKGARVVGIAGGQNKCQHAVEVLGFDACIDHRAPDLSVRLAAACPDGIDVYFESVGGPVLDAVLPLLNMHARIPVCGFIAHYNHNEVTPERDQRIELLATILSKRIRMEGFIILDHYASRFAAFQRDMTHWFEEGRIALFEDLVEGLELAPAALSGLLQGYNFGKVVVRAAD